MLAGLPLLLRTLAEWPHVAAPEETGSTFAENARLKAHFYAAATGLPTVAEDSGLEIRRTGRAPGLESARFGGADRTYPEKFALIYERLARTPAADRSARFVCALALVNAGQVLFEALGTVEGQIAPEPRGNRRLRLRPHLLLPAVRLDPRRVGFTQGRSEPSRGGLCPVAAAFAGLRSQILGLKPLEAQSPKPEACYIPGGEKRPSAATASRRPHKGSSR